MSNDRAPRRIFPDARDPWVAILLTWYQEASTVNEYSVYILRYLDKAIADLKALAREEVAREIFALAHEYARNDKTMRGAETLRDYHYFNAINEIGGFGGR